jgi:hypothetical protein
LDQTWHLRIEGTISYDDDIRLRDLEFDWILFHHCDMASGQDEWHFERQNVSEHT